MTTVSSRPRAIPAGSILVNGALHQVQSPPDTPLLYVLRVELGGEPAVNLIAPAISNAIFDATGVRVRTLPMRADAVKEALGA